MTARVSPGISSDRPLFSALEQERIFVGPEPRGEDARRQAGSLLLVALIYSLGAAIVLERRENLPPLQSLEIPVEVVVSPPEPPAPLATPEPAKEPTPKPPDRKEMPAYDAPKQGEAEKDDGVKPVDAKPPAPETTSPQETGDQRAGEAPAAAPPLPLAEHGELAPAPKAESAPPAAPLWPRAAAGHAKPHVFASLPSVEFGGAPKKAPIAGGDGPAEYLNIVIALIRAHLRKPEETRISGGMPFGVMVFVLDADGHVTSNGFVQHSGSAALDRAEADALEAAAPFPKPPYPGRAIEYRFLVN